MVQECLAHARHAVYFFLEGLSVVDSLIVFRDDSLLFHQAAFSSGGFEGNGKGKSQGEPHKEKKTRVSSGVSLKPIHCYTPILG